MKFVVTEWSLWFKDEVYGSRMEFLLQAGVYGLRIKFRVLGWSLWFNDEVYGLMMDFMVQ